jgi:hypothetical protein
MFNVDQYIIESKLKSLKPEPYKEVKKLKVDKLLKEVTGNTRGVSNIQALTQNSTLSRELAQAPPFLREALSNPNRYIIHLQSPLISPSLKYKQYFLPLGCSISKPFISDQRIQHILKSPELRLRHGDVVHVPFTSEEEYIVQLHLNSEPKPLQDIIQSLYEVLPGRTVNDISRYIKGNKLLVTHG